MNYDEEYFEDSADQPSALSPIQPTASSKKAKKTKASQARWTASPIDIEGLVARLHANTGKHAYNKFVGVSIAQGYNSSNNKAFADIGSVDCRNCFVEKIQDAAGNTINLIFKVASAEGVFADLLIPNAPLAGGFSLIGEKSDDMIVTSELRSALVIHESTGHSVAVAHSVQNVPEVCRSLLAANPNMCIIVAMGVSRAGDIRGAKALMAPLVGNANIRFALPKGAPNFHQLYAGNRKSKVKLALASAITQPEGWEVPMVETEFPVVVAWPEPVHPAGLLAGLCAHIARHTSLNFVSIAALALWIAATHFVTKFHIVPIAALLSLTKRCGKTTTLAVIASLVRRPLVTSDITAAGLYHACSQDATVLADEVEQYINRPGAPLVGLFNAGQNRTASKVWRIIGGKRKSFDVHGFKALCAIGELPGTVTDRAIIVPLLRKSREEEVTHYHPTENDEAVTLRAQLEMFARQCADQVGVAKPVIPDLGSDRAVDNWSSLFAVASCAGDGWLANASEAALALTQDDDEVPTVMEEFIRDLAEVYLGRDDGGFITSAELIWELCKDPQKPWATFTNGRSIGYHDLSSLMRRLKLRPEQKRRNGHNLKGYALGDLKYLFERYVPT